MMQGPTTVCHCTLRYNGADLCWGWGLMTCFLQDHTKIITWNTDKSYCYRWNFIHYRRLAEYSGSLVWRRGGGRGGELERHLRPRERHGYTWQGHCLRSKINTYSSSANRRGLARSVWELVDSMAWNTVCTASSLQFWLPSCMQRSGHSTLHEHRTLTATATCASL